MWVISLVNRLSSYGTTGEKYGKIDIEKSTRENWIEKICLAYFQFQKPNTIQK